MEDVKEAKALSGHPYIERLVLPTAKRLSQDDTKPIDRYIQLQVNNFALDFQDIQYFALHLLNTYKDVRSYWQDKLNYVMVDEVQDCSKSDWELINIISEKYNNLFIVGDPDQAIYEWRGALPKYLVDYEADKDIILAENYRSTPNILDVANSIIDNNEERVKKDLFTKKPTSKNALYYHGKTEEDEATWVANRICELNKSGVRYNEIAILYRASYLSRNIEQALIRKQVKYTVWGGIRFFERKEIKDALAYLRLVVNRDDLSFQRIVNVPSRRFGSKSMNLLKELSEQEGTSLYQTLFTHKQDKQFDKESIHDFLDLIEQCEKKQSNNSISELFDYLLKNSGLWEMFREEGDEDRIDNINELINSIRFYESVEREEKATIETYLQDVALFTNADYKDDGETVKLMTIHQAKGLEFPFVFVCGLNEMIFPSIRTIRESGIRGLEEERRLMYVAVTRAEWALFLTESEGFSYSLCSDKIPSRFIIEIKENLLEIEGDYDASLFNVTKEFVKNGFYRKDSNSTYVTKFKEGDCVIHKTFGTGVIESCEPKENGGAFRVRFSIGIRYLRVENLIQMTEGPERWMEEYHIYQLLSTKVKDLNLSTRTLNVFMKLNIVTIKDLVKHSSEELKEIRGFGKTCLQEVEDELESLNLHLGYDVDPIIGKYDIYRQYIRERSKTLVPILRTPLIETRIQNTDYYETLIKNDIVTIGDLMVKIQYYSIKEKLHPNEIEDVLSFFCEKGIDFFDPEPYYDEYDYMQSSNCEIQGTGTIEETAKNDGEQLLFSLKAEPQKDIQFINIVNKKDVNNEVLMKSQESNILNVSEISEIMKKARSGNADAILYCAQHKINPFNFDEDFFFNYDDVRIGDWFYDDGSFSRNRSDLKRCVGVVFSLETSQLEQADGWTHGLIVAIKDAAQAEWEIVHEDLAYPHTHYSAKELELLEKSPSSFNDYHTEFLLRDSKINAFRIARKFKVSLPRGKTSGWFLPSISQLRQIACNLLPDTLSKISMNSGELYWSSSQSNANEACYMYISNGENTYFSFGVNNKKSPFPYIRPILAF